MILDPTARRTILRAYVAERDAAYSEAHYGLHQLVWCFVCTAPVICLCKEPRAAHFCRRHQPPEEAKS